MSATVIPLPGGHCAVPGTPPADSPRQAAIRSRRHYSFADVVRLLGIDGQPRTQVDYLRDLHRQQGLPLPINPRRWRGVFQRGAAMISTRSKWCALEMDAWLEGHGNTPQGGAALDLPSAPPSVHATLRHAALRLAGAAQ